MWFSVTLKMNFVSSDESKRGSVLVAAFIVFERAACAVRAVAKP
jgi:hypothetical protein